MLVVNNVVNSNLVNNGRGLSIDDEVLAKQMKLDKGKCAMTQKDHVKIKSVSIGNGIVIRENDNASFDSDIDCENENDQEKQVNSSDNEIDMGFKSESDESKRSFDYLSNCDYEVIELRKRKSASKNKIDEDDENALSEHEDFRPSTRNYDIGDGDTIKQHELFMEELMEEKIKDPSKGKQRPYKNFSSNNADKSICPWRCYRKMLKTENSFQVLHESNEGSTIKIGVSVNPDEKTYFDRMLDCMMGHGQKSMAKIAELGAKARWRAMIEAWFPLTQEAHMKDLAP
ncbi:hypothetical protein Tco_0472241 [Tanacetum coccineum]